MDSLKSLFFGKYRATETYEYKNPWRDQSITVNGTKISVIIAETEETAKGVVVLAHPMKKLGKQFFIEYGHAAFYLNLGYHVYILDFNGFGESPDRDFGFPDDVVGVIESAKRHHPVLPLYLHGVSFGASQIILGCLHNEDLVQGLIVESAVSSNLAYYKGRGSKLFHILNLYNKLFPKKNEHNIYYKQVSKLRNTPVLYIYGEQDVITPKWMGEKLFEHTKTSKTIKIFDTKHLTTIQEEPKKYKEVITAFLSAH